MPDALKPESAALRVSPVTTAGPCDWCPARARFVVESERTNRAGQCCYRHAATALRWVGAEQRTRPVETPAGGER